MSLPERIHPGLGPMTFGILGVAVVASQPTSATAQSYPWCAQGDNIVHCYYMTREQCEAAVNYHGFCIANSSVPTPNNEAPFGHASLHVGRIAANIAGLPELLRKP